MSTQVQQLRGTTAENNAFTGKAGVITVDTEKNDLRIHDGTTRGGVSILEKATDLQRNGGVINGDVTINDATGISYAILPNPVGEGNPTIRLGYTKKSENFCDLAFVGDSFNIYLNKFGDVAKFYNDGTTSFAKTINIQGKTYFQSDGNIIGQTWINGNLASHIESRCVAYQNACVTDSQMVGWADVPIQVGTVTNMPSGYVVTAVIKEDSGRTRICGRQPQLKIANRGWFALGTW